MPPGARDRKAFRKRAFTAASAPALHPWVKSSWKSRKRHRHWTLSGVFRMRRQKYWFIFGSGIRSKPVGRCKICNVYKYKKRTRTSYDHPSFERRRPMQPVGQGPCAAAEVDPLGDGEAEDEPEGLRGVRGRHPILGGGALRSGPRRPGVGPLVSAAVQLHFGRKTKLPTYRSTLAVRAKERPQARGGMVNYVMRRRC